MTFPLTRSRSRARFFGVPFSPAALFANGEQGAWYDPSDFGPTGSSGVGTLFQDAAGTTPVTAVEQAVGLMLDKSKGLVLGPELVTNGDFSSGTGWTAGGATTLSVTGGVMKATGTTDGAYFGQQISVVAGNWYKLQFSSISDGTSKAAQLNLGTSLGTSNRYAGSIAFGTNRTVYYNATATETLWAWFYPGFFGTSNYILIDDVSVKLIAGNHAYQSTGTSRPILRARYNQLTNSEQINGGVTGWFSNSSPTVTTNNVAPDGSNTASKIIVSGATINQGVYTNAPSVAVGQTALFSVWLRGENGGEIVQLGDASARQNVTLTTSWQRFTNPSHALASTFHVIYAQDNTAMTYYAWGAQLLTAADVTATGNVYQRVAAATVYDTSNAVWRPYLAEDGSDDSLLTNSVDFATVTSDGQARRNLLLNPTQFDAAGWTASAVTVTANTTTAPDGSSTADKITETAVSSGHSVFQNVSVTSGTTYTMSAYLKKSERDFGWLKFSDGATNWGRTFNLATGQVGNVVSGFTAPATSTITDAGNGWWRCTITVTAGSTGAGGQDVGVMATDGTRVYLGDGTSGIFLWGAQLETGSTATAFQNIGTDKMTVFAGVTKLSDAALGFVAELSANSGTNAGTFGIFAPRNAAAGDYAFRSVGTGTLVDAQSAATYAAPITNVFTGIGNIGAPVVTLRLNGAQAAASTASSGTGNFGNYPLYIGRRNNATLPFNGRIYSLIVRGAASTAAEISATEAWVNQRTGAY